MASEQREHRLPSLYSNGVFQCASCSASCHYDYEPYGRMCRACVNDRLRLFSEMRLALDELHAEVSGECPSLLDEDRGGNGALAVKIETLLRESRHV